MQMTFKWFSLRFAGRVAKRVSNRTYHVNRIFLSRKKGKSLFFHFFGKHSQNTVLLEKSENKIEFSVCFVCRRVRTIDVSGLVPVCNSVYATKYWLYIALHIIHIKLVSPDIGKNLENKTRKDNPVL